jgi:hypothetical protein
MRANIGTITYREAKEHPKPTRNEWFSPQNIVDAARRIMGEIELDPVSCYDAQGQRGGVASSWLHYRHPLHDPLPPLTAAASGVSSADCRDNYQDKDQTNHIADAA